MGSMDFGRGAGRVLTTAGVAAAALLATATGATPAPGSVSTPPASVSALPASVSPASVPALPASVSASPAPGAHGGRSVSPARARGGEERLWLFGGLVTALAATGLVARAALRDRTDL
ncbi:hypothetical protein [Streptomyces sp. WAC08241]|uniref:hypothetical protein n=1 Tax=Streptomyces sp. WAC08241 TaxID=2487421 RepID=UPI000F791B4A|nr:hypothetical protein [Streptomyces sp. WAC08241]RSS45588.1 hypothetical protein EF906_04365 [Streptomyces sp. WAC08241]